MSAEGLGAAQRKMLEAGLPPEAIDVFAHYYRQLEAGATGLIRESDISPLTDVPLLESVSPSPEREREALAKTAIIKLNGGLGTSMGLDAAKTLLPVREGRSFLDLIVGQILRARKEYGVRLPLLLMNSFRTREDCLEALASYPELPVAGLPIDFIQHREPKLRADNLAPVEWPRDPSLEWCPPGHGDLYVALQTSGVLQALLDQGFRYASVANGDNLGAAPSARIAGWFAASGAPYAAELCLRTANDRKGGHLAIRNADGRLILRDTAQTAPEEMAFFTDEHRHPYFHTNNLWFDLAVLSRTLRERGSVLGLPLIKNPKTVDPRDKASVPVIQMETAMGSAVEVFEGAAAIVVGRERFLPVKTTNELLLVRSDAFELTEDDRLVATTERLPEVALAPKWYQLLPDFDSRLGNVPSLRNAESLRVEGDWTFGPDVTVSGEVTLPDTGSPETVAGGSRLSG